MASSGTQHFQLGQLRKPIRVTLRDADDQAVPLTGVSASGITLRAQTPATAATDASPQESRDFTMAVVSDGTGATESVVEYVTLNATDFDIAGEWELQVLVQYADGRLWYTDRKVDPLFMIVTDNLPAPPA